jgi:hypothetical protein
MSLPPIHITPTHAPRFASSSPRRPEGEYEELLPWLLDQAADFEAAAAAGAPAAPPLLLESPPRYRLFDASRGGCAGCARALLRAAKTQSVNRDLQAAARWGRVHGGVGLYCIALWWTTLF